MCTIDALFVMYAIGGGMLGWFGMKGYRRWSAKRNEVKQKPDDGVSPIAE